MKELGLSRRDFLKASTAGAVAAWLGQGVSIDVFADHSASKEKYRVREGQWFYPSSTSILLIPIRKDWTFDDTGDKRREPVSLNLSGGALLQARNVKSVRLNGQEFGFVEVPFVGSNFKGVKGISANADQYLALAIVGQDGKPFTDEKSPANGEILAGFTGIWGEGVYPSKIWNTLEACRNLLEYQEENDGFAVDGKRFSFEEIQKMIAGDRDFKAGYNMLGEEVRGGGIDAAVALLSRSIYPFIERGAATYVTHEPNPEYFRYFTGPASPEITETNADQIFDLDSAGKPRRDFVWRFNKSGLTGQLGKLYLSVTGSIVPDTGKWEPGNHWLKYPADAKLVLTMTWSSKPPEAGQIQKLQELMRLYSEYHEKGPGSPAFLELNKLGAVKPTDWSQVRTIAEKVHPELRVENFKSDINGSGEGKSLDNIVDFLLEIKKSGKQIKDFPPAKVLEFYYALIYYYQEVVRDYSEKFPFTTNDQKEGKTRPKTLGDYLTGRMEKDGILASLKSMGNDALDKNFRYLNYNTYLVEDEALQCLGWVANLGELNLPVSPTRIWDISTASASGLLSEKARRALKSQKTYQDEDYEDLYFVRVDSLDEVEVGDSFVRWGGSNNHIGTVIGKKVVAKETVLLVTDANRKNDGAVRVFEVDKNYFRVIFGDPAEPLFPVVIRNKEAENYINH